MCRPPRDDLMDWLPILLAFAAVCRSSLQFAMCPSERAATIQNSSCPVCGYDVRSLLDADDRCICPECGTEVDARARPAWREYGYDSRGLGALSIMLACTSLPWITMFIWTGVLRCIGREGTVNVAASSLRYSTAWSDGGPQILIAGAVCAMSVAMLLCRGLSTWAWTAQVAAACAMWVCVYLAHAMPLALQRGWIWSVGMERNIVPFTGVLVGVVACLVMWAGRILWAASAQWRRERREFQRANELATSRGTRSV